MNRGNKKKGREKRRPSKYGTCGFYGAKSCDGKHGKIPGKDEYSIGNQQLEKIKIPHLRK